MEGFVSGEVVVIEFPFSDLSGLKKRPVLILKEISGDDLILCQITSHSFYKQEEIEIKNNDFTIGGLKIKSYARFTKLFTLDRSLIKYKVGKLKHEKIKEIINKVSLFFADNKP